MPNWCNNYIIIRPNDSDKKLKKFSKLNERVKISIKTKEPLFASLLGTRTGKGTDWYSHNVNRWGTKWDVDADTHEIDIDTDQIVMNIQTAWSPPNGFLLELCETYGVNATIEFEEGGCDFAGVYEFTPEGLISQIDYDSVDEFNYNHNDCFWENVSSYAEDLDFEETTLEDFINQYPFITDEVGKQELKEVYEKSKSFCE